MTIDEMWDGRELRKLFGWSKHRWNGHWTPIFPAYYQWKHAAGSVRPQLIRAFPASQLKVFIESNVWLKPPQKRRTK